MLMSSVAQNLRASCGDGAVIAPGDDGYDNARRIWNGVADKMPAAIVKARSIADIRTAIETAARQNLLLAVRSGGHSLPGLSTCDGGIVLDLSQLNGIVVNPVSRTAEVSGGALLGDLDRAGAAHGLVVPAGVVSHTGAAGLTLGGGMGWLSRRYRLTIDSLKAADIITANGDMIRVSKTEEPELFWGLRGGGGNFGVVTKLTYRMHPLGPVSVGTWHYALGSAVSAIARLHELAEAAPRELTANFNFGLGGLHVTALWSGTENEAGRMLAQFGKLAADAVGQHGPVSFVAHQSRSDEAMRWGRRYYSKGGFFSNFTTEVIDAISETVAEIPAPDCDIYVLQLGGAVGDVPDAETAYTGRAAKYYWIASAAWDDKNDDQRCMAWGRTAAARLAALSMSGNYVNEQGDMGRDVAVGAYGAEKYRRLQRLKARFDPGNLFRLNQNIEPAA